MNDIVYNHHLKEIFRQLLKEDITQMYTAQEILFNTYGLIIFNNQPMSFKKRNKIVHNLHNIYK
tara:strand:- start:171 stop:362 length:192 start_codon:yes stop_codon:yes gene_type:complete